MIRWLLDGEPAIRWQVFRDLIGAAERTVERERRKVARDGWGAPLLARQDPEGTWAGGLLSDGGLYSPKFNFDIYLPEWLARHNKLIFGALYVAGIVFTLVRWLSERR